MTSQRIGLYRGSTPGTDPGIVTQIVDIPRSGPDQPVRPYHLPFGLLKELDQPRHVFRDLGPNWYASIMGTGIVAVAGASLPLYVPGLRSSRRPCGPWPRPP